MLLTGREVAVCHNSVKRVHLNLRVFLKYSVTEKRCCPLTYLNFTAFEILAKKNPKAKIRIFFCGLELCSSL